MHILFGYFGDFLISINHLNAVSYVFIHENRIHILSPNFYSSNQMPRTPEWLRQSAEARKRSTYRRPSKSQRIKMGENYRESREAAKKRDKDRLLIYQEADTHFQIWKERDKQLLEQIEAIAKDNELSFRPAPLNAKRMYSPIR